MRRPAQPLDQRLALEIQDVLAALSHDVVGGIAGVKELAVLVESDLAEGRDPDDVPVTIGVMVRGAAEVYERADLLRALHRLSAEPCGVVQPNELLDSALVGEAHTRSGDAGGAFELRASGFVAVVQHLLRNAREHGIAPAHVHAERDDEWLWIRVSDEGPGIAPRHWATAARPFTRFVPGGSGMGLALARRYAHLHGGALEIDDEGVWLGLRQMDLRIRTPLG